VHVTIPTPLRIAQRPPVILYGTSEEMTVHAWSALERGDTPLAIQQAKATIEEWSPFALKLQQKKIRDVGHLIDYNGEKKAQNAIFSYWALNDVGACYFILGKIFDEKGDYSNAANAFQQISDHYSLAQVWDPKGWFWAPMDALTSDYVSHDPAHYGNIIPEDITAQVGKHPMNGSEQESIRAMKLEIRKTSRSLTSF
jgi:hypothetical protein